MSGAGAWSSKDDHTILIESMTRVEYPFGVVRAWRQEESFDYNHKENYGTIVEAISKERERQMFSIHFPSIAQAVLKLPRMNAVEILDREGQGLVIYKDWP